MILSALLPGLRDLRLPLSVGLTWLAAAWLFFRDSLPPFDTTDGVAGSIYAAVQLIGQTASLSVLIFIGYLLGALLTVNVMRQIPMSVILRGRPWDRLGFFKGAFAPLDPGRKLELSEVIEAYVKKAEEYDRAGTGTELARVFGSSDNREGKLTRLAMTDVVAEIPSIADKVQLERAGLFETYDRRQSEAEFRQAISFPLAGLAIVLAIVGSAWFLLALLPVAALWFQGVRRAQGARSTLIGPVLTGQIRPTMLVKLEAIESKAFTVDRIAREAAKKDS